MSDKQKTVESRKDTLQQYVSDMIGVEEHIWSAVKQQVEDADVGKQHPEAAILIGRIADLTRQHAQNLEEHLESLDGDAGKGIKELASATLGAVAGLYDRIRSQKVSKMLRDNYTALNLAAVSYTMLHTTALALHDQATARLALRHLKEYTPIIMQLNELVPGVVHKELQEDGIAVVSGSIKQAILNTQEAWQPSGSGNGNNNISREN